MGKKGGEEGGGEGGRRGGVQGEVDQPQAQCLPRISTNVPLERSHTRHGKKQCAPSRTYTRLTQIHGRATDGRAGGVDACPRRLIWSDGAGDCARHQSQPPFVASPFACVGRHIT